MILGEAFVRRANGTDDFCAQVRFATNPVVKLVSQGIEEKSVDREVTANRIFARIAKPDAPGPAAILIAGFGASVRTDSRERPSIQLAPASEQEPADIGLSMRKKRSSRVYWLIS